MSGYYMDVNEAMDASEDALYHLEKARRMLESASRWGVADMLGGGMFVTMAKRSKMKDASYEIASAKNSLYRLGRALNDFGILPDVNIQLGGFSAFADYAFDGLAADVFAQSRIDDAKRDVADAIAQVRRIQARLERSYRTW